MKKNPLFALLLCAGLGTLNACSNTEKPDAETAEMPPAATAPAEATPAATEPSGATPQTYTVVATPDTARLGKSREAFVRIQDLQAVALSDPDGKSEGTELTYKLELTNQRKIGGNSVGINTGDFRLVLDNGTKVSPSSVYVSADAEATVLSSTDKFKIPAGARPVALNLFFDQTQASIKLEMK